MTYSSRKIVISADAGLAFLVARAALPVVLTWLANLGGRKIPGYQEERKGLIFDSRVRAWWLTVFI
jgi:hypothetical protein